MQFFTLFRFRGLRKTKHTHGATIFPSDWPSYLHSKCSTPKCWFPNPPQAAAGTYNCRARPGGAYCKGTYNVTSAMAASTTRTCTDGRGGGETRSKKAVEAERPTREPKVKKQPSKLSIFKGKSQKALKETLQKQEYLNNKSLPSIPGLSQRKVNRTRFIPRPLPSAEAMDDLGPLYPEVVLHYYFPRDQLSNPTLHGNSTGHRAPLASSRSLGSQRRPRSGDYTPNSSGTSFSQERSDQRPERPRHHAQLYRYHGF